MSVVAKAIMFVFGTCVLAQPNHSISVQTASVRPHEGTLNEAAMPHLLITGNRISVTAKLSVLVMLAYGLAGDQIGAGPAESLLWDNEYFDVTATLSEPTPNLEEARQMLRQILVDCFQLKAHWEVDPAPGFDLKVGQGGSRLHESAPDALPYGRVVRQGLATHVSAEHRSMTQLAILLSALVGQPVNDKTGLAGLYDFALDLKIPESGRDGNSEASISKALQEQLGLTLVGSESKMEKLIVDRIARPDY